MYFQTRCNGSFDMGKHGDFYLMLRMPGHERPVVANPANVRMPQGGDPRGMPAYVAGEVVGDRFVFLPGTFPDNPEIVDAALDLEGCYIIDDEQCESACHEFAVAGGEARNWRNWHCGSWRMM